MSPRGTTSSPQVDAGSPVTNSIVALEHLRKEFAGGKVVALDDVSLTVPSGQLLALIGLSGSGKSTLLRHLNGLHLPTSGRVEVLGTDVAAATHRTLRRLRLDVGFIFQSFNLVGRLSCLENVVSGALGRIRGPRYGLAMYSTVLRREALAQLERVGLDHRALQRADTLSGGQQQRVAIARTLMQQPKLVLADEPVASLDPQSSAKVMEVLFRVCSEDHLTVVCSLHQVELALTYADRIVGLRDGAVVFDQPAKAVSDAEAMAVYGEAPAAPPRSARPARKRAMAGARA